MDPITPDDLQAVTGDRYQIGAIVGRGGMGVVYRATHTTLGNHVAIKVLPPEVRFDAARLARFQREASLSAQLSHPNIVPVFEFETQGDIAYLVMPFIDGTPLDRHLGTHGPMDRRDAQQLVTDVGSALAFAHSRGVIHRDVKPANLLLEQGSGRWMLTDFGVAHVAMDGITDLTQSGATIGTLDYMAPEQLGGAKTVDGRADLYSLAVVTYEALMGRVPDRIGTEAAAKLLIRERPDIAPGWLRTLSAGLSELRDERPGAINDWLSELSRHGRWTRRRTMAVVGMAIVTVIAATGVFQALRGPATPIVAPLVAVFPVPINDAVGDMSLDSVLSLSQAITWQLQTLPGERVLTAEAVSAAIARRYGNIPQPRDTLLAVARRLGADEAALATATLANGNLSLRLDVFRPATGSFVGGGEATGSPDSLHRLVTELVVEAFAGRLAEAMIGTPAPSLPTGGLPAIGEYVSGHRAFRRGAMEDAVRHFERVIELDSTFAPAHLKRGLALIYQTRPSEAGPQMRAALAQAIRYVDRLDPPSTDILNAYVALIRDGQMTRGSQMLRSVLLRHPDAVDAWFLLGALQARFPTLAGATPDEARQNLLQVTILDPSFGFAHAVLLQIGALAGRDADVHRAVAGFLAADSTSLRAATVRVVDTLIFRPELAPRVVASFPTRPMEVLENIGLAAGELRPAGGTRGVAAAAVQTLFRRAATTHERSVYGRMRLATLMGSGQIDEGSRFAGEARRLGVPPTEVDQWVVLGWLSGTPLASRIDTEMAVERLSGAEDYPLVSRWLHARWALRESPDPSGPPLTAFHQQAAKPESDPVLTYALQLDLEATRLVSLGLDSATAIARWDSATTRYSLDHVIFGLVESLWPLHLDRLRVLERSGRYRETVVAARHFERMAGFVDQMAWFDALTTASRAARAMGDTATARGFLSDLQRVLTPGARRDSVVATIRALTSQSPATSPSGR